MAKKSKKVKSPKTNSREVVNLIVGMVIYNEEVKLQKWLEAHPFVPNIIIIDQGSTDNSREIAKADPRVKCFKTNRFECIAEPDLNLIPKIAGQNTTLLMAPDEFISEAHFVFVRDTVTKMFKNFDMRCFYISRKNFVDDVEVSPIYANPRDPEAKNWQLRITIGDSIKFANVPYAEPEVKRAWAYIDSEKAWLEHRNSLEEVRETLLKRSPNLSQSGKLRDSQYLMALLQFVNKDKDA